MSSQPRHQSRSLLAYGALAIVLLVWGVAPVFVRSFSVAAGPRDAIVIRMLATGLISLALLLFAGGIHIARRDWPRLILVSAAGMFGYYAASIYGFSKLPAGIGGMIMATQPIIIALLAAMVQRKPLPILTVFGLILSFLGTLYLLSDHFTVDHFNYEFISGAVMIFVAGIAWSVYVVFSRPLIQRYGSYKMTLVVSIICMVVSLGFASSSTWGTLTQLDHSALFSLFYLAVIGSLLMVVLWNFAAGRLASVTVGTALYLVPVLSVLAGSLLLHEVITPHIVLASAIILSGVALAQVRTRR